MLHDAPFNKEMAGRAAYDTAMRCQHPSEGGLALRVSWEEASDDTRRVWAAIGEAVMASAGLHVLVGDVLSEHDAVNAGIVEVAGQKFLRDAKGRLVPVELVKPADKLEDEMVRKVMAFALDLSAQIARFKEHTFADLNGFQQLLEQEYGARAGGEKGNVTFQTVDGLMQVKVQIADLIEFGPQLQQAKSLIDECLLEWGADARPEIKAIVSRAFAVEKEGQINKANLFLLLKLDIVEERWTSAMLAIRDAIRVTGTKEYVRFYRRQRPQDRFETVTIDLAAA